MPLSPGVQDAVVSGPRPPATVVYLHGFASSPASTKARYFGARLSERGIPLLAPDLNQPDFATLTMSRMLEQVSELIHAEAGPVTLMGSSLGAALAILAAERLSASVDRLVLLAPAVMIATPGHSLLPPERLAEWARLGRLPFFHYAYDEERMLDYTFYADSLRHDPLEATFTQPTLIFQGVNDTVVDPQAVEQFARGRANVQLAMLDDDHQLSNSLAPMWSAVAAFLEVPG